MKGVHSFPDRKWEREAVMTVVTFGSLAWDLILVSNETWQRTVAINHGNDNITLKIVFIEMELVCCLLISIDLPMLYSSKKPCNCFTFSKQDLGFPIPMTTR